MSNNLDPKEISFYAQFPEALYEADHPELIPKGYMIDRELSLLKSKSQGVYINDQTREVVWVLTGTRIKSILQTDKNMIVDLAQDAYIFIGGITGFFGFGGLSQLVNTDLLETFGKLYRKYHQDKREPYRLVMASHSLGASQQQLLMSQLLEHKNYFPEYKIFIKDVYGFNLGLSPADVIKFYTGLHYISKEDREYWEAHNHLIIVKGDIISSRIANPETFDYVMPQHVQILEPKENFNAHTILNFFTEGDLKEVEKIVSPNVIEESAKSMPPVPKSQTPSIVKSQTPSIGYDEGQRLIDESVKRTELRRAQRQAMRQKFADMGNKLDETKKQNEQLFKEYLENLQKQLAKLEKLAEEKEKEKAKLERSIQVSRGASPEKETSISLQEQKISTPIVEPNNQMSVNRGFKSLTGSGIEKHRKQITTRSSEVTPTFGNYNQGFYSIDNDNRRASQNPQTGISPAGSQYGARGASPLSIAQARVLSSRSTSSTTSGKIGGRVLGSSYTPTSDTRSESRSKRSGSSASSGSSPATSRTSTESEIDRESIITELRGGRARGEARHGVGADYTPIYTDPYRIQSAIERHYDIFSPTRVKRAPILKRQRKFVVDPVTGKAIETYETTATYGSEAPTLVTFPEEHKSIASVHPLIGEKPRVVKGSRITNKETPLPPSSSKAVVRKSGLKPDKKYDL